MKKNIVLLLISLMIFPFIPIEVKAASVPYNWIVGGETVDTVNTNGTATLTKDSTNIVLTLNNYNGGPLELNCYGTGQSGLTFTIHLIGENSIVTENGIGIIYDYEKKIQFTGEGKLTIQAPQPISYENYTKTLYISPSEQIYTDTHNEITEQDSTTISDSKDKEEGANKETEQIEQASTTENNIILYIAVGGYVLLSLIVIIYLMIQNKKKTNL